MFLMLVMLQSRQELRRLPNRSHTELLAQRLELAARETFEIAVGVLLHGFFVGRAAVRVPGSTPCVVSPATEAWTCGGSSSAWVAAAGVTPT